MYTYSTYVSQKLRIERKFPNRGTRGFVSTKHFVALYEQ